MRICEFARACVDCVYEEKGREQHEMRVCTCMNSHEHACVVCIGERKRETGQFHREQVREGKRSESAQARAREKVCLCIRVYVCVCVCVS